MKARWLSVLAFVPLLAGCGQVAAPATPHPTSSGPVNIQQAPIAYMPPHQALPRGVLDHLASYPGRVQAVSGPTLAVSTANPRVLFVDPTLGYAIAQFVTVWKSLPVKPAVVWIHTNASIAAQEWTAEGYHADPLPSTQTFYTLSSVLSPAAFVHTPHGWLELAGVLRPSQVQDWVSFFSGTGTAPVKKHT